MNFLRPDWLIIGVSSSDGTVHLYASTDLTNAELSRQVNIEEDLYYPPPPLQVKKAITTLTASIGHFTVVTGFTYAEALARLLTAWKPDVPSRKELH